MMRRIILDIATCFVLAWLLMMVATRPPSPMEEMVLALSCPGLPLGEMLSKGQLTAREANLCFWYNQFHRIPRWEEL